MVHKDMQSHFKFGVYPEGTAEKAATLLYLESHRHFLKHPSLISASGIFSQSRLDDIVSRLHESDGDIAIYRTWHNVYPFAIANTLSPNMKRDDYISFIRDISTNRPHSLYGIGIFRHHAMYLISKAFVENEFRRSISDRGLIDKELTEVVAHYTKLSHDFMCSYDVRRLRKLLGFSNFERVYFKNGFALWHALAGERNLRQASNNCDLYKPMENFYASFHKCFSEENFSKEYIDETQAQIQSFVHKENIMRNIIINCGILGRN